MFRSLASSATPWSRGLGKHYDDLLIAAATTADLIERGYLSPFKVFAPSETRPCGRRHGSGRFSRRATRRGGG